MDISLRQVTDLLVASFGVRVEEIQPDVTFAELDVDSLALVEFAMMVEKEFGVSVGDDELSGQNTVRDVVALIEDKKKALL
jgi:acyl carrier protein